MIYLPPLVECTGSNFYKFPGRGDVVNTTQPVELAWNPGCLDTLEVDIFLFSVLSEGNPVPCVWENVDNGAGRYSIDLDAKWWNFSKSVLLGLIVVPSGQLPFNSSLPMGPLFTATYSGDLSPLNSKHPSRLGTGLIVAAAVTPFLFLVSIAAAIYLMKPRLSWRSVIRTSSRKIANERKVSAASCISHEARRFRRARPAYSSNSIYAPSIATIESFDALDPTTPPLAMYPIHLPGLMEVANELDTSTWKPANKFELEFHLPHLPSKTPPEPSSTQHTPSPSSASADTLATLPPIYGPCTNVPGSLHPPPVIERLYEHGPGGVLPSPTRSRRRSVDGGVRLDGGPPFSSDGGPGADLRVDDVAWALPPYDE